MKRGAIYRANLVPRSGSEQTGRCPVIILSHDAFNQTARWRSIIVITDDGHCYFSAFKGGKAQLEIYDGLIDPQFNTTIRTTVVVLLRRGAKRQIQLLRPRHLGYSAHNVRL